MSSTLLNQTFGVEAALGGDAAQSGDAAGTGVIRGEREEAAVELIHRLVGVVLVHHGAGELHPGVDVRLEQRDVADLHVPAGRGHHLHDPDRAGGAPGVLLSSDS